MGPEGGAMPDHLRDAGLQPEDWAHIRGRLDPLNPQREEVRVPPRYREQVDSYFRKLARESARQEGERSE